MQIVWLGHSSFEIRAAGKTLVIDPWLENPSYPAGYEVAACDVIAVTHGHFDHIGSVAALAARTGATVVANYEIATWLSSKGVSRAEGMNKGGTIDVGGFGLTMTHATHSSTIQDGDVMVPAGEACGFVVSVEGKSFYYAGDTGVHSDMALVKELYAPELAFLPIGDRFTMGPREAALAVKLTGAKRVIPMHYGTFELLTGTPGQLQQLTDAKVEVLRAGEPWTW